MGEFEEFTQAASAVPGGHGIAMRDLNNVAILGGGADARLIAALCLAEGANVTLFSAYGAELDALRASSGISLRGDGPVGTYQIDRQDTLSIKTTAELDRSVSQAELIFLTGAVHKQRTYAMVLSDHLKDGQVLVIAPGRSMGAIETIWLLRTGGCKADITIVEAQNLPYWITQKGNILHLSAAGSIPAATLPHRRSDILAALGKYLPNLEERESVISSGFEDGSALVEIPALLMGGAALGGTVEIPMGGQPLAENATFASLLGPEHRLIIERLVQERRSVASRFGVRNLPDCDMLISRYAGAERGAGSRPIPDRQTAITLIRDGVIASLVPLQSAADLAGIEIPATRSLIVLSSTILGTDLATAGRRLDKIGIDASSIEQARGTIESLAAGHI